MTTEVRLRLRRLDHGRDIDLPSQASPGSAGLDLRAAVPEEVRIEPGGRLLIPTGFAMELPDGWEGQVRPRSGLAVRHGVTVANAPGTIDSDYRGEVKVSLINLGAEAISIRRGDRIAQLVVSRTPRITVEEVAELSDTHRGRGGFGSTGLS